jgi:hypothetical protein
MTDATEVPSREWLRRQIKGMLFNQRQLALKSGAISLWPRFQDIDSLGLYLHIPFCHQICRSLQDVFSIDYVGKLWGSSQENPWPGEVSLWKRRECLHLCRRHG